MLGCAAFHAHRRAGYWHSGEAVERLARDQFDVVLAAAPDGLPYVDNLILGRAHFVSAFAAGYRQRAERCGAAG